MLKIIKTIPYTQYFLIDISVLTFTFAFNFFMYMNLKVK